MGFLKDIFARKEEQIKSYSDFWAWFKTKEKDFFKVVKNQKDIEKSFFDKLSPRLEELKDGYFYLTGMYDDNTVELVLTADGDTKNIVFVEELVAAAPQIDGWRFTALKPALDSKDVSSKEHLQEIGALLAKYPDMGDRYNEANCRFVDKSHAGNPSQGNRKTQHFLYRKRTVMAGVDE
ncbi:MAG TPA: hypothetical protein VK563_17765 [Puia sp.]|nr:hypothetical protein [Puia sp.]